MKNYGQNLDEPAVLVTASKGQAAAAINGTTLYSAFNLRICEPGNQF